MNEISSTESIKFLKNKKTNLAFLDVRERKQYVQGFAFGSINCPISNFKKNVNDLVPDKETVVLLIGIKNKKKKFKLFKILNHLNYKRYFSIKDNYKTWLKCKFPYWSGEYTFSKAFGEWVEITSTIRNIFPKDLNKIHKKKNNYLQIDARPKKEFEKFSLPFSVQCSGGELPIFINNNSNLKKNYIVHCAGRTRSIIAHQTLNDYNFNNKKYVLSGGTQNWVLKGYQREYNNKSKINLTKINLNKDLSLAKKIAQKFNIPCNKKNNKDKENYYFQINSEIKNFKKIKGWKSVSATTLIQNTDKFIASTNTKIFIYSNIPSSSVFAVIWLRRMGFDAIWQIKKPLSVNKNYQTTKPDQTYFFSKRHFGNKNHSKGYLDWEHSLIPIIKQWGCQNPWVSAKKKNLGTVEHSVYRVYKNII